MFDAARQPILLADGDGDLRNSVAGSHVAARSSETSALAEPTECQLLARWLEAHAAADAAEASE